MNATLPVVAPFDLRKSIAFLRGFGPMAEEQELTPTTLTKGFRVEGRAVVARVSQPDPTSLACELLGPDAPPPEVARAALARVRRFLGADEDLGPFYELAAADPPMAALTARLRGMHHVTFPSAFEAACWGVTYQRCPLARARAMKRALVRAYGSVVVHDGAEHAVFPDAPTLAAATERDLEALVVGGRRPKAIAAIARAFAGIDE